MLQVFTFVRNQRLRPKLVNRIGQKQNFNAFFAKSLQQRIARQRLCIVAGNVINRFLLLVHPLNVSIKRSQFVLALGGVETRQRGDFLPVGKVFVNSLLKGNTERVPEFCVIFLVLRAFL